MKKLWNDLNDIRRDLARSIFVGERYEKNMRGISLVALLIVIVNTVTGILNLIHGYYSAAVTAPVFILAGLLLLYFTRIRKNRDAARITAVVAVILIFTYEAFTVSHGFPIFWTLLLPLAFCYLASVRSGILLSLYFLLLYLLLFYTPLRGCAAAQYSDALAQRFPILYLADVLLTALIMVQYHRNTLRQMDNARQLLEAKEAAERANRAKSDFLANMSHEIRTPINAVLGMNEMILREDRRAQERADAGQPLRETLRRIGLYAGDVESAGHNLLAIVNDILDFSKIEAGRMDLTEAPYQLSSVLNDVSNMILFKARDKGLDFVADVDETLPDGLLGDEVRVRQIITNILNNAVKYTEQGSVRMTLRGERAPDGTLLLSVSVRDTGIGIRAEDLDKLFTKFQRLDLDHNGTVEGTGLGLAITKRLLEMMGGSIDVQSEYGKGSTFTVTISQKIVSAEPVGDFQKRFEENVLEAKAYHESFRAPSAHILIVDDTRMNLTVAVGLLQSTELRIDTARSGADAVALAKETAYDAILMDQRMPEMDGTETLRRIRSDAADKNGNTPVICLTADAVIGAKERYLAEGFSDYLTKPIDSRALEKMLMKHLPKEKLIPVRMEREARTEAPLPAADGADSFARLRSAGLDAQIGLQYAQGDEDFFRSLLAEYARSLDEKEAELRGALAAEDWKDYAVFVHALKSTSKLMGASELSVRAAALEAAAGAGDGAAVRAAHGDFLARAAALAGAIRAALPEDGPTEADGEEVLEFAPEGEEPPRKPGE